MLYEQWRQVARAYSGETALVDCASGKRWTFAALADAVEQAEEPSGDVVHPQGISVDFILTVLAGWRWNKTVCPLESNQVSPHIVAPPAGIVHLKSTSATTGVSRWVAFTAGQLAADAANIVTTMGLNPSSPNLGAISLAHSYGFSNLVTPLLLHGIPLYLVNSPLPETVRQALLLARNWTVPAVPALWRAWQEAGVLGADIRLAISAGAPLPLPLEQQIYQEHKLKIHNFYGATECGGIAYDATVVPRLDAAQIGAAMHGVELSVNDQDCLEVRGTAVGSTYWPAADESLSNGCFRTSDLVRISGGQIYLSGRASDQINVAGRKVSPEEIERALLTHPAVKNCLVFGLPAADERGEIIAACVLLNEPISGEMLRGYLLARLPAWQTPREWRFVESFEVSERGKLSRREWRERLLAERKAGRP